VFVNSAYPASSYTLSADDGSFSSPPIGPGGQWKVTFISKGAHIYRDVTSPQRMVGELLVVDSSVGLLPTPLSIYRSHRSSSNQRQEKPP
jgi:hypothetical protein